MKLVAGWPVLAFVGVLGAFIFACGAAADDRPVVSPVTIAIAPVSSSDAGVRVKPDAGPPAAPEMDKDDGTDTADGWGGPRDATELIGAAGAAVTGSPREIVLVHSSAIRADPLVEPFRALLLGTLPGWNAFMPYDVVDPINDIDWVLMTGSLVLGETESNVFIAHYNVSEPLADKAMATLATRLPKARAAIGFGGPSKSLIAFVDGADRLYVRPRPGVLAIVPVGDGKRIAELLARVDVPAEVRKGELIRAIVAQHPMAELGASEVTRERMWVRATRNGSTTVRVEGDCDNDVDAASASQAIEAHLADAKASFAVRAMVPWLARIEPHAQGKHVLASVDLTDDEVRQITSLMRLSRGVVSP